MKTCPNDRTPPQRETLCVAIPAYRGTFAAHDFNELETRRADRELAEYLVSLLMWPRLSKPRKLLLQLPRDQRSPQQEHRTAEAYHTMFCHRMKECGQKLATVIPTVVLLVCVGVGMLYLSNHLGGEEGSGGENASNFWHTFAEAIRVGGWVASWTAIALFFYDGVRTLYRLCIFWRLARLPVEFCYQRSGTSADRDDQEGSGDQEGIKQQPAELPDSRLAHQR
ncbi:hypothetical protein [Aeoliella sp. SH292]|jgi:hypothetical protein|uniref:hypothetical protein n=1 Tax=Aeoliella sp. SH292 TaxID=3454464 RepID=UPI003F9C4C22